MQLFTLMLEKFARIWERPLGHNAGPQQPQGPLNVISPVHVGEQQEALGLQRAGDRPGVLPARPLGHRGRCENLRKIEQCLAIRVKPP
jgi:hypothetical protein